MDPISIGLALASLYQKYQANKTAGEGLDFQRQNLANALTDAQRNKFEATQQAGGIRQDQFGNATYYDPTQGRWLSFYTPQQQRLLTGEQAAQERALTRGAQASEDYAKQRAGYLYNQPPTEALIRQQIMDLVQQSQGTGERALNTIMDRFGTRTAGNIPTITQMDKGPTPGQQLAETMLKARAAALAESGTRQKQHDEQYLPGMNAFERTANTVLQEGPTGKALVGLTSAGQQNMMKALDDYMKTQATIYGRGGQDTGAAYANATKAATDASQMTALIQALKPTPTKTTGGTLGGTTGATGSNTGGRTTNDGVVGTEPYSPGIGLVHSPKTTPWTSETAAQSMSSTSGVPYTSGSASVLAPPNTETEYGWGGYPIDNTSYPIDPTGSMWSF